LSLSPEHRIVLWRRLDVPGHDACRIVRAGMGWTIEGMAVFMERGVPASLSYRIVCDQGWVTRHGRLSGWAGRATIDLAIARDPDGRWSLNGIPLPELDGLADLDLGFTPATNTNAIRRMRLAEGEHSQIIAAWLDPSDWKLKSLEQTYERVERHIYDYRSPRHDFRARLRMDEFGVVVDYPGL
jgi:uncharacterized protein